MIFKRIERKKRTRERLSSANKGIVGVIILILVLIISVGYSLRRSEKEMAERPSTTTVYTQESADYTTRSSREKFEEIMSEIQSELERAQNETSDKDIQEG